MAAVTVTAVPVAALAAGPLFRRVRAGTRSEAIAGSVLIAGGLTGLALLPGAELAWTIAPQVLVGLGLGLSVDSLTAAALRDRIPRALHGGWTIAARHAGVVAGLAILTPIFTADLRHAETPAKEAVASLVLDAPLPASTKLDLADGLGRQLIAERGRVPDLRPAFATLRLPAPQAATAAALERGLDDQLRARRDPARSAPPSSSRRCWPCWRWCPRWRCATGAGDEGARPAADRRAAGRGRPRRPGRRGRRRLRAAPAGRSVRPARDPAASRRELEPVAERIVLLGLDNAACRLGVSRERLVLALADTRVAGPGRARRAQGGPPRRRRPARPRGPPAQGVRSCSPRRSTQADLPGFVKTVIGAIPDGTVDSALPTRPLLRRAVDELDVDALVRDLDDPRPARVGRPVGDPPGRARPDPRAPAPLALRRSPLLVPEVVDPLAVADPRACDRRCRSRRDRRGRPRTNGPPRARRAARPTP